MVMHFFPRQIYIVRKLKRKKDIKKSLHITFHARKVHTNAVRRKTLFFSNEFILLIKQVN